MSDHAIGLIGLALAVLAVIAPYRWPKVSRIVTDLGLILGTVLAVIAFEPEWAPFAGDHPVAPQASAQPALPLIAKFPVPKPTRAPSDQSKDQKEIEDLKAQLASVQGELEKAQDTLAAETAIQVWGTMPPNTLYLKVDSSKLAKYKGKMKLMFIARVPYANVDRMSDTAIAKSQFYSISGDMITMTYTGLAGLRLPPPATDGMYVEFDLVGYPQNFASADNIKSLNDVEPSGGTIIIQRAAPLGLKPPGNKPL